MSVLFTGRRPPEPIHFEGRGWEQETPGLAVLVRVTDRGVDGRGLVEPDHFAAAALRLHGGQVTAQHPQQNS